MSTNPIKAYEQVNKSTVSGRELEASVLMRAAALLKQCQDNWESDGRRAALQHALEFNQRAWSIFQAELAKPDHPLPAEMRQNLLRLSLFIDKQIFQAMASPAPDKLTAIININCNLAAGLRGSANGEA